MKTIESVKESYEKLLKQYESVSVSELKTKTAKQDAKRFLILKNCLYYLESNPNEEFLKQTYQQLKNKLKLIEESFTVWLKSQLAGKTYQQLNNSYSAEMGIKKIKEQIKTLEFLLEL